MAAERMDDDDLESQQGIQTPNSQEEKEFSKPRSKLGVGIYLTRHIDNSLTSIPILLCCFCSGLIDSSVFNAWGVFATMQTGMSPKFLS